MLTTIRTTLTLTMVGVIAGDVHQDGAMPGLTVVTTEVVVIMEDSLEPLTQPTTTILTMDLVTMATMAQEEEAVLQVVRKAEVMDLDM